MKTSQAIVGLLVGTAIAVALVGCATSQSPTASATPTPAALASLKTDSQWSHLQKSIPASGKVDVSTALTAFNMAIGPVPGAAAESGVATPIESGSVAIDWILADWTSLTSAEQQAVVGDLSATRTAGAGAEPTTTLASARIGPSSSAQMSNHNAACQASDSAGAGPYRSQVLDIEKELSSHTGVGFPDPIVIVVNTSNVGAPKDRSLMYTYGCAGDSINIAEPDTVTSCDVHIQPRINGGNGQIAYSASDSHSALIHELTHCLLIEHYGSAESTMPPWFAEGVPTWAQSELSGGDAVSDGWWQEYLDTPNKSLSARWYDAIGFFVHLQETGTDVWQKIFRIGDALDESQDSTNAGFMTADPTTAFLDNWGSGFAEGRYSGTPWKTGDSDLPAYQPPLPSPLQVKDGGSVTAKSNPLATKLAPLDVDAQVVLVLPSDGSSGQVSLGHGDDVTLEKASDEVFCAESGGCKCPAGSVNAGATFTQMADGAEYAGVTGGDMPGSVLITGETLDTFCTTAVVCMVGTWRSTNVTSGVVAGVQGEANVIWTITDKGLVTLDYNGSSPLSGPFGVTNLTGTQVGRIALPAPGAKSGGWNDTTVSNSLRMNGVALAAGALGDAGSWTCNGDQMTINLSGDGGDEIVNLARESH